MAKKSIPTPEKLRQLLSYDEKTGKLFWLPRSQKTCDRQVSWINSWNKKYSGKPALNCLGKDGYFQGWLLMKKVFAHRAIWAMNYDEWPDEFIDHIDGNKTNNTLLNLRKASRSENARNRLANKNAVSKYVGVSMSYGKWRATIALNKKQQHIGVYDNEVSAALAYDNAARLLHGDFAKLNFPLEK